MRRSRVQNVAAVSVAWFAALVAMVASFFFLYTYGNVADSHPLSTGFLIMGLSGIHLVLGVPGACIAGMLWKDRPVALASWACVPYLPLFGIVLSGNPLIGILPGLIFSGGVFGIYFLSARLFFARRREAQPIG